MKRISLAWSLVVLLAGLSLGLALAPRPADSAAGTRVITIDPDGLNFKLPDGRTVATIGGKTGGGIYLYDAAGNYTMCMSTVGMPAIYFVRPLPEGAEGGAWLALVSEPTGPVIRLTTPQMEKRLTLSIGEDGNAHIQTWGGGKGAEAPTATWP